MNYIMIQNTKLWTSRITKCEQHFDKESKKYTLKITYLYDILVFVFDTKKEIDNIINVIEKSETIFYIPLWVEINEYRISTKNICSYYTDGGSMLIIQLASGKRMEIPFSDNAECEAALEFLDSKVAPFPYITEDS